MFRLGMQRRRLDRALAVLADLAASTSELAELRDDLVAEGERVLRRLLGTVLRGAELEVAALPGSRRRPPPPQSRAAGSPSGPTAASGSIRSAVMIRASPR
jgi:hypothetical protein